MEGKTVDFIYSVQPVISKEGERLGAVLFVQEIKDVYRMAHTIAGTRAHYTFDSLAGGSPEFLKAVKLARRAAGSDGTVLVQGETGTGKELFAQAIHNHSTRRNNPFIPINCGAIPSNLLESELFGYVAGTFTGASKKGKPGKFELADTGTILLDEIGDMPHRMQVKLLRVLQTGEVYRIGADKPVTIDTRIIAATNINLPQAIKSGRFREDLYYRLNVFAIEIPPLKARGKADILALARLHQRKRRHPAGPDPGSRRDPGRLPLARQCPGAGKLHAAGHPPLRRSDTHPGPPGTLPRHKPLPGPRPAPWKSSSTRPSWTPWPPTETIWPSPPKV